MVYSEFQDIKVSSLGFGAMRLPAIGAEWDAPIDEAAAKKMIDYAIDNGVNYFDTAYIYHNGKSETFLGGALSRYPRESYFLADKFNLQANPNYEAQFQEQLNRLKTDYIDFYLLHGIQDSTVDDFIESGCIPFFEKLKSEGAIRYFGFSFHGTIKVLRRLLALRRWDFVQIQLNYFDWAYSGADSLYEELAAHNTPIMVMEPVRGGKLASLTPEGNAMLAEAAPGRSVSSWAMRWLMDLPQVAVVLSGMSSLVQVEDNIKTFAEHLPLDGAEKELVTEACQMYRPTVAVPCTACRYCLAACPKELDIPGLLSVYNEVKMDSEWRVSFLGNLAEGNRPGACIGCGVCAAHCPQNIDIPKHLAELNALILVK